MDRRSAPSLGSDRDDACVVIEVSGANVVLRAAPHVTREYTEALAEVINAATDTDTCVVIDPDPIRCDETFAAYAPGAPESPAARSDSRPCGAEVVSAGIVRLRAERTVWLIDVSRGRLCRADDEVDVRFLGDDAWHPIVAVYVSPTRLVALGADGGLMSAARAALVAA